MTENTTAEVGTDYTFSLDDVTATTIPEQGKPGRKPRPNPLAGILAPFIADRSRAGKFTVAYGTPEAAKARQSAIGRDLTKEGKAHNVQVRRSFVRDDAAGTLTVTFWVTDLPAKKDDADAAK